MVLDEPQDNDEVVQDKGITFIVDKVLYEAAKPIYVDFIETDRGAGFMIKSGLSKPAPEGGGDCCGSCSC